MAGEPDRPSAKPRLDKLGIRAGMSVAVIAVDDAAFGSELAERGARTAPARAGISNHDAIFLGITRHADLGRLARLRAAIQPAGAVWAVWRKGRRELNEIHVRAAALAAGLVDVKVVAFSPTHSALKLVIPVARRPRPRAASSDRAKSCRNAGGIQKSL